MDRFTFAALNSAHASPMHVPGYIAEFGSGSGETVIAKYVKIGTATTGSLRVGEPLFLLNSATQVTFLDPYSPFLVTPDYDVTGYVKHGGVNATSLYSMVGCAAGVYTSAGVADVIALSTYPYFWCVLRGPIKGARQISNVNAGDGVLLKPVNVDGTYNGSALDPSTSASDMFIVGVQRGASGAANGVHYPVSINCFISMPRWW